MKDPLQQAIAAGQAEIVETDLDDEPITLPNGDVLDEAAAQEYGEAAVKRAGESWDR